MLGLEMPIRLQAQGVRHRPNENLEGVNRTRPSLQSDESGEKPKIGLGLGLSSEAKMEMAPSPEVRSKGENQKLEPGSSLAGVGEGDFVDVPLADSDLACHLVYYDRTSNSYVMEPNRIIMPVSGTIVNPSPSVGVSTANGQGLNEARPKSPLEGGIKPSSASVQTGRAAMSVREGEVVFSETVPIPATG